MPIVETLEKRS